MAKKIVLILLGVLLMGCIVWILWRVNEREQGSDVPKEAFIPNNSAVVLNVRANVSLSPRLKEAFETEWANYQKSIFYRSIDTLQKLKLTENTSWVLALRREGKKSVRFLYILNRVPAASRSEVIRFLADYYAKSGLKERSYDKFKIYSLRDKETEVYFAVVGGMVLLSDSELYLEDALKQIGEDKKNDPESIPVYKNITRYFSETAGMNIFLNTSCFSDVWPLYMSRNVVSPRLDLTKWFKWGALDGEIQSDGIGFNGFMYYGGMKATFLNVFKGQQPMASRIEGVIPSGVNAVTVLNLSDTRAYLTALETFRHKAGIIEHARKRKSEFTRLFGEEVEASWRELLQGEFAKGVFSYDPENKEEEGFVMVYLKSGSLGRALLKNMLGNYAVKVNINEASLERTTALDQEKKVAYYKMPVTDFAGVLWGYIWDGVPSRFAMIQDNYLILASSESVIRRFAENYMRRLNVQDMDWYKKTRVKMSAKYNWMYLAETGSMYPFYRDMANDGLKDFLTQNKERLDVFSSFGLQWISEDEMLYQSVFLNTEKVEQPPAQVVWQTKLDAKLTMKPVVVVNHNNGERELFVQDDSRTVYLINDMGRILWKLPIDGKINSEVYQVDFYKNGKLQYLFSTSEKLYLIDRNGNYLPRYPLAFKSSCPSGITVYDYDNDRNYRVFAPCADRKIYLYELSGDLVEGWSQPQSDNDPVSKVYYFRVADKDYIVFADRYRIYILDRRGRERVKVQTLYDLLQGTVIYLTGKEQNESLVFGSAGGELQFVDFNGASRSLKPDKITAGYLFNVADTDGDGNDDFIFSNGEHVYVYDRNGKVLWETGVKEGRLGFPYVYRFSARDTRVGTLDESHSELYLLDKGSQSNGFPITGTSAFSIVFQNTGKVGFYLYVGSEKDSLLKYRFIR
ncbi:hypothetical protein [Sanguibacteroides justesenii]|uniref:DUF3352 domain-containing protein n=1 Tax=Sanguibacteroides justesenii TaxID=1547597 RepID=A0A0C3NKL1_9PORP|nr:hypothetical protein [Sanguibacteroides justesenii]KIO46757.1 hypothetical protein BA92_02540 [Sanguibacteroides justesenii]